MLSHRFGGEWRHHTDTNGKTAVALLREAIPLRDSGGYGWDGYVDDDTEPRDRVEAVKLLSYQTPVSSRTCI